MKERIARSLLLVLLLITGTCAHAQLAQYKGDNINRYQNIHSGNKVRTIFYNYGLVGNVNEISCEWPLGTGNEYVGDVTPLVAIEFTHPSGDVLHSVITCSSPRQSPEYIEGQFSGFEPLPGFAALPIPGEIGQVAMSHQAETWPDLWPDKMYDDANDQGWELDPFDPGWSGSWNGYFGKGVENADQESYFQMDDHSDIEWFHRTKTVGDSTVDYYFYPDATDSTRRGLGIRVSVRGLQWSHFLAEDCIFWLYEITNIGTVHYDKACFGMVVGTLAGGRYDSEDDLAFFDPDNDITYSWDGTPGPIPGWVWVRPGEIQVGYAGYAFLESPGNPYDGIDNDGDSQDGGSPVLDVATLVDMTSPMTYSIGQELITIDYETYDRTLTTLPGEFPGLSGSQISTIRQWITEGALERNVGGDSVSYADDIRPIFNDDCISCHASPASAAYSHLDLTTYQGLMDTTVNDTLVVLPYYPNTSKLVTMIEGTGAPATVPRMPPRGYLNWDFRGQQRTLIADFEIVEDPHNGIDDNYNGLIDERFGEEVGGKRLDHLWLKYIDYFTGAGLNDALIDEARDDGIAMMVTGIR
jgi:hypothetical protein